VPALEMNSPVVFRAGTSSTNVWIGAGGMGGLAAGEVTWGVSSTDGSFFFGKAMPTGDTERRQIIFDAAGGTFQFGSEIVVQRSGGNMTLDDIATAATSGGYSDTDVQDYLNAGVTNILAGTGGNYRLHVDTTDAKVVMYHKDAVYAGYSAVADSTNTRLPAIGLTSAGIAMGFNDVDGNWKNAVAITADGSFAFGHTAGKQILWDGAAGALVLGSDVKVSSTAGPTMSTVATNASYGYTAYTNKLDKYSADILYGVVDVNTSTYAGGLRVGSVTWNTTTGAITGGSGVVITKKGLIGVASGVTKFSIDGTTGDATFAGVVSTSQYVQAMGSTSSGVVMGSVNIHAAVYGVDSSPTAGTYDVGVFGRNTVTGTSTGSIGVLGMVSRNAVMGSFGVMGHAISANSIGVYGVNDAPGGQGVRAESASGTALFVSGTTTATGRISSTVSTGTAPFSVASTTLCSNLNADLLDGYHASSFALSSHQHSRLIHDTGTPHTYAFSDGGNTGTATANWVGLFPGTTTRNPVWVKFYIDTTAFWIPMWQH
jgi:hypothetical protein